MSFVLAVCQYGHSRSVSVARQLHKREVPAIAMGLRTAGLEAIKLGCERASDIIVVEPWMYSELIAYRPKLHLFPLGPDRWVNPYHPELEAIINGMLDDFMGRQAFHFQRNAISHF